MAVPAVTLISAPDLYSLSQGGRTLFRFQGRGRLATTGTKAVSSIVFTGSPIIDGTTIPLRWNNKPFPIVAKAEPSGANEFPTGDGSAGYVDNLVEFFKTYFPFREDFVVSRSDLGGFHAIVLTAKLPGPQYNVAAPVQKIPIVVGQNTIGADPLVRTQYSIYAELWYRRPGQTEFKRAQPFTINCDNAGQAKLDVGQVLHAEMNPDWPTWSGGDPTTATTSHLEYYVAYAESYANKPGEPQQVGKIFQDSVRHIYYGGADYLTKGGSGLALTNLIINDPADPGKDIALRYGSMTRYVRATEPQFLSFINLRNDRPDVTLEVSATLSDNSSLVFTDRYTPQSFKAGGKLTYATGISQLRIAEKLPEGKTLREYSVRLRDSSGYLSVAYRYILVASHQPHTRHFAYVNSLGSPETLTTFGKGSYELTRFYEQAQRWLPTGYDTQLGQFVQYDVSLQQQIEVATGYRTQTELRLWNDFYRSPFLFHMLNRQALPISLVSKSIKQQKDGDNQFAHKFEFVYAWKDDFFTAQDEAEALTEPTPPTGSTTTGPITITQPVLVESVDKTVPDAVRGITDDRISKWDQAYAWGNPALKGYLTQDTASGLFLRKDTGVDFYQDVKGKPTTRDGYGLRDVLTAKETSKLLKLTLGIKPVLKSWTGDQEPL